MKESWLEEPNCEFTVWLGNSVTSSTVPVTPLGKGKGWDKELFYLKKIYIYINIYIVTLESHSCKVIATVEKFGSSSCALAWRIPGTGEPGGLPSLRSHRVGHD